MNKLHQIKWVTIDEDIDAHELTPGFFYRDHVVQILFIHSFTLMFVVVCLVVIFLLFSWPCQFIFDL